MKRSAYPCCFSDAFVREQIDPRVAVNYQSRYGKKAPFGNLRQMWVQQHCKTLNPYGSDTCPYDKQDCAMAFYVATQAITDIERRSPTGYFRTHAKFMALQRADDKPLARSSTIVHNERPSDPRRRERSDGTGREAGHPVAGRAPQRDTSADSPLVRDTSSVRRANHRPTSIGEVLGAFDFGARSKEGGDGRKTGSK